MNITKKHINKIKLIKQRFLEKTRVPKTNKWKKLKDDDIWHTLVMQVMVVGRSLAAEKFYKNSKLRQLISYARLLKIKDENQLAKDINYVLREVGTRYASKSVKKCRKTQALVHNFKVLSGWEDGPRGFLKTILDKEEDKEKIKFVIKKLKYLGNKGARDFLMDLGIVQDAIAFDKRVLTVLNEKVGIKVPEDIINNPELYDKVEAELLSKVCKPLGLSGVQFDRMIYQNYNEIMKLKFN